MTRYLVIDCDGGVDDAVALWWALRAPEVEVVALVATWGNVDRDQAAANLGRILHAAGRTDVPVALGAQDARGPSPLGERATHVHGLDGLGGCAHQWSTGGYGPVAEPAAEMLARLASERPGQLDLVTTGALTSLAAAAADPVVLDGYRSLTVMGGSILAGGNALPLAEANIGHDPSAAATVVAAGWRTDEPPLLVGLDVTMLALLARDTELAAAHASTTVPGRFLAGALGVYADFYDTVEQAPPGRFPCHDLLAVMAAAGEPVVTDAPTYPLAVDVGRSAAWGATVADRRPVPESDTPGFAPWRVALGVDPAPFRAAVRSLL